MATKPTPSKGLIEDLRTFLRDKPEFNRILENRDNKELGDDELALALRLALSDFNTTPPLSTDTFNTIPEVAVLFGGMVMAMHILGLGHTRNEFNYTSGGVTVRVFDKTPHYMNWINRISANYEALKSNYKISRNIEAAIGTSVPSEYTGVSFVLL